MSGMNLTKRRLIFMRHGRAEKNSDYPNMPYEDFLKVLVNGVDDGLDEKFFDNYNFSKLGKVDIIFHSNSKRASETAALLNQNLPGNPENNSGFSEDLAEIRFSEECLTREEFEQNGGKFNDKCRALLLTKWYDIDKDNGVESFNSSKSRLSQLSDKLNQLDSKYQNILIITHGWFLRLIYLYYTGGSKQNQNGTLEGLLAAPVLDYGEFLEVQPDGEVIWYKKKDLSESPEAVASKKGKINFSEQQKSESICV